MVGNVVNMTAAWHGLPQQQQQAGVAMAALGRDHHQARRQLREKEKIAEMERQKEEAYDAWLSTFRAARPDRQQWCKNILTTKQGSPSQFGQDLFLFFNIFKYWPQEKRRGFYVDSGANHAIQLSNTYFFDVCLGWYDDDDALTLLRPTVVADLLHCPHTRSSRDGLCVEPEREYHHALRQERSCKLITECISSKKMAATWHSQNTASRVTKEMDRSKATAGTILCDTLPAMLGRYNNRSRIDFWSLDVEGYEMTILQSVDFSKIDVKVVMVEEQWVSTRNLDRLMNIQGFSKYHQIPIDGIYTHRRFPTISSWSDRPLFYPKIFDKEWKINTQFRIDHPDRIKSYSEEEVKFESPKPFQGGT
jgi:hypothetical protein